jgi:PAS domain S-box-containing protein
MQSKIGQNSPRSSRTQNDIRWTRHIITGVVFAAVYYGLDYTAVNLQIAPGVSAWYPPSALSLVLLSGISLWYSPVVFLVGMIAEVVNYHQSPFAPYTVIETADVAIGYLVAAAILRKYLKLDRMFHRVRDFGWYFGIVATAAFCVAVLGVAMLELSSPELHVPYWRTVFNWWVGDTVALVSVAPFLFLYVLPHLRHWLGIRGGGDTRQWLDPILPTKPLSGWQRVVLSSQFAIAIFTLWLVFGTRVGNHFDLLYLCFVPVVWIAASGGAQRTAIGLIVVNSGAVAAVLLMHPVSFSFVELQLLMLVISVTGASLGAAVDESTFNETKLRTSTTHLNALIDNSPLAIVSYDHAGRVTMANPAFEKLFGYLHAEIVNRPLDRLITSSEFEAEATEIMKSMNFGVSVHTTTKRIRRTGELVVVELFGVPLYAGGAVNGGYEIYKDVTDQKKLEEELALSQKLQAVGRLAGGVAHDFNNILGVVQGYSEYMVEQLPATDPMRESAEEILHSAHRGSGLVRQLLSFSRKQAIEQVVLDLNAVMSSVQTLMTRLIGEDIDLKVRLAPEVGRIKADPGQLEQIILNLAVNARDAMPRGGVIELETSNCTSENPVTSRLEPYVMMLFRDSGVGMSQETLSHIFEPFFTTKEKGKGTGLGLSTVYGIVEQSGGQVRVESELGRGTTFRIYFPCVDAPTVARRPEETHGTTLGGAETILLVEDQEEFRRMMANYLTRHGYNVLIARNGAEAIQISSARHESIDLLLSDVVMPGIRGPLLAKILAQSRSEMAVLFMSGYTDGSLDDSLQSTNASGNSGSYGLISKPFTWQALGTRIRDVLETPRLKREMNVSLGLDDLAPR